MFRLELEYRQFWIYILFVFIFYYLIGYHLTFWFLIVWVVAPLEELDPDEVEDEEELWPFIENTYLETNWNKGNIKIQMELKKSKNFEKIFSKKNFEETNLFLIENKLLNQKILILNDISTLKSIYV